MTNITPTLSLKDNFAHMMARLEAGSLSEEDARTFRRLISEQIDAAERLALDTSPDNSPLFLNARMVLGFTDHGRDSLHRTTYLRPKPGAATALDLVRP